MASLPENLLDRALEATVVGSFSRIGITLRRRAGHWNEMPPLSGRKILITGGSSGIGRAAAVGLGRLRAEVWVTGRDRGRLAAAVAEIGSAGGRAHPVVADLVVADQLDDLVSQIREQAGHLDGVVHNAGALFPERQVAPDGTELTVATHVLAPYRLTGSLVDVLEPGRSVLVTVSSGGMYTEPLDVQKLEMSPADYRGAVAYARAKRAQVVLAAEWDRRLGDRGVHSYSMHPGWARTPGLDTGLPRFSRLGPLLRSPEEGADTIVWLLAQALGAPEAPAPGFYLDRSRRGEHYRPGTSRPPSTPEELWAWCAARTGQTY